MDREIFQQRLLEAQTWCHFNRADNLRTVALNKLVSGQDFLGLSNEARQAVVEAVANRRADLLNETECRLNAEISSSGKILAFNPDYSLFDGAAKAASDDFFDWDNIPACDTWICYIIETVPYKDWTHYLLAWVPPLWVERVETGIAVNCEGCIEWAENLNASTLQNLRAEKLLE